MCFQEGCVNTQVTSPAPEVSAALGLSSGRVSAFLTGSLVVLLFENHCFMNWFHVSKETFLERKILKTKQNTKPTDTKGTV